MSEKKGESLPNENGQKPSKPKWWKPFWILTAISMVGSGVFTYFFLHGEFVRIIIYEIIFSLALGGAYYIRVRPSKKVNKVVYILFGITPIGFGLSMLYALICGITNFGKFIVSFKPFGPWFQLGIIIGFFTIGGFIGNWIGKKRDYRLPLSLY
ncbi:MAG: hypothetical protein KAW66_05750 [Candidatus Lokiarchaeota archaeon]|nr:hypothetical protein [Candidatus Lokiarchaeota archaeon]